MKIRISKEFEKSVKKLSGKYKESLTHIAAPHPKNHKSIQKTR
jgi:mRNA-degrading endonuclease RelE of RelBE toxin-antitoxin system